jgi:L-asparaginase
MTEKPLVAVIGTGGTISSWGTTSTDVLDYPEFGRKMPVTEVIGRTPELAAAADILPVPFLDVGSTAIGPAEWLALARKIHQLAQDQPAIAGFVILHGTATLEETAYFLHLVLKTDKTVVLVGAQRPASALSSDGPMNLLGAVRVAMASAAHGLGVLVVLNDEIHSARDVTKTSTYRLQTFRTPDLGVLGHVDGDGVQIYRRPARRHTLETAFVIDAINTLPRVDIAYSYGGCDGAAVDAFIAAGARGIVSAGLAPGISTPHERAALRRAKDAGVVIVQSSRAGSGRVALRRHLAEAGLVAADNLNPQKARILLMLGLAQTDDIAVLRRMFETY